MDVGTDVLNTVITAVITIVGGVITAVLIPMLVKWLSSKTNSENLQHLYKELGESSAKSVEYIEQTMVKQLKSDGKWDSDAQSKALQAAADEVAKNLTAKTKQLISKEGIDANQLIIRYIESHINSMMSHAMTPTTDTTTEVAG